MGKVKKNVNFGILGVNPYVPEGVPQSCLDPLYKFNQLYLIT
jgi:hypothetical protein